MVEIEDRDALARTPAHELALECVVAGIEAARPERVLDETVAVSGSQLRIEDAVYDLGASDDVLVLGGGNAAGRLAAGLESRLAEGESGGVVVADESVVVTDDPAETNRIEVVEGSHPVPDRRALEGAHRVREAASAADEETLVLAVVTGGGSALLPAPAADLELDDLQATTDALLESGATIDEINAVRKHLSAIKGGRLARRAEPATVVTMAVSDVVGDRLDVIASGPTVPDSTTYEDALAVVDRYDLDVPAAVRAHLEAGVQGDYAETPGAGADVDNHETVGGELDVDAHVLAGGWTAIEAARSVARERGYEPLVLSTRIEGEARQQGLAHAAVASESRATGNPVEPPAVILSGGETTVTVADHDPGDDSDASDGGTGRGGPNQELALAAAGSLPPESVLCAVDTDGIDGGTDAAGAVVDVTTVDGGGSDTWQAARDALDAHDAYSFLDDHDALVKTGHTGTNVNDLRVLVVA